MLIDGHPTITLAGPIGPFYIPAEPAKSRESTEFLSRGVWDGEYDHPELPPVSTILDIGSGWGAFAVWARAKFGPDVGICCYDPHALGCRFAGVNDPKATVLNVAVTTDPRPQFWPGTDWGSQRTVAVNPDFAVPVNGFHPKDLPAADCIKIDGEGIELEVLTEYRHQPKVIMYEWHTPELRWQCYGTVRMRWPEMRCLRETVASWGEGNGVAVFVR